ncbi:MAG TPA: CHAD domain-containing protein [Hyphomicrobiaceae bacterium]|nr:CHAD domain-containing protein [Hyphomicrobiaceae bacterium]
MSNVSSKELELKLELTPQELLRVAANPALEDLTVGKPVTKVLRSIYFDTPDHRLHAKGIALRLRAADEQWVQTVKDGQGLKSGVSNPREVEAVVARAEPDLAAIEDPDLRRAVEKATRHSALEPQFETVVTRTTRQLHSDKGDMELALDEGIVRAGGIESKLCEVELELKAGSPECLLETATALFGSEPIRVAEETKSERGYRLALGRSDPALVPLKAERTVLSGNETCAEALQTFVASAGQQIELNRRAMLETDDPEAAHQLRVGLRRLRSALRAFRPLEDSVATRELARHAKELGQSVGELRNADIFIESIYVPVAAARKEEPGFPELREALVANRDELRGKSRAALLGEQWSKLQLYLALWPHTVKANPRLEMPITELAASALDRSWSKIAKRAAKLETMSPEERHEMRKTLKVFRYAVEYFESLYEPHKVRRFIKDLKRLQDVFGYLNDVKTARALDGICDQRCPSSPAAHRAAGYTLGWHDVNANHAWADATNLWRRLAKRERFWE